MKKLLLIAAFFFFKNVSFAQFGELDPTFGINGIVKTNIGAVYNVNTPAIQVLAQPGGTSIYLVSQPGPVTVSKKLANGLPDSSYGYNGVSTLNISAAHAAIQADGKIVIAGYTLTEDYFNITDFAVARLNTNGTLDNTFGVNGIRVDNNALNEKWNSVVIQPDGKILVAGIANNSTAITQPNITTIYRLNTDGSLDPGFSDLPIKTYDKTYFPEYLQLILQKDGKILLDQEGGGQGFLARLQSNGNVDIGFIFDTKQSAAAPYALQSDQKILAVSGNFGIKRFNTNGSLDNNFGAGGLATITIGASDTKTSIAVSNDDKIILAGYTNNGTGNNFAVARFNANGSIDNTFSGNGHQVTDFGFDDRATSVALESNGKIVVYGSAISLLATPEVAVYNTNGSPDVSFHGNGMLADHFNQGTTHYTCTAVQADGKPVAAGYTRNGTSYDFAIARYNLNGSLDSTFSGDGKQTIHFGTGIDQASAIALQADGKIVVAGIAGQNYGLVRFNTDGSLDNTFDGDGIVTTDFGNKNYAPSLVIGTDGKIFLGGSKLARYNTNGSLDLTFDGDGKVDNPIILPDGSYLFNSNAIAVQKDKKVLVVSNIPNFSFVIGRYNINGSPDSTFGQNGYRSIFYESPDFSLLPACIAIGNDGKIVVGGSEEGAYRDFSSIFIAVRLNTDGSLDNSFNGSGMVYAGNISYDDYYCNSVVIQPDNKIILGGYGFDSTRNNFTVIRLNVDGTRDSTFTGGVLKFTRVSGGTNEIGGLALGDNALYAAGYGQFPGDLGVIAKYSIAAGATRPVAFINFTAALQRDKTVRLQWQTFREQRLAGFTIERSGNLNNFAPVGYVKAKGNSIGKISYFSIDKHPLQGKNFYRLKITDTYGAVKYSKIVLINTSHILVKSIT